MPSTSPDRGARVVWETEKWRWMPIGSSCLRAWLMSVVFPAPEGPETMNKVPSGWKLLDILNLLPDALDLGFQFYNEGSEHRRARFGAHRVDFAQHLLREKVEFL